MPIKQAFDRTNDDPLANDFLDKGYVILDVEDRAALDEMRREIVLAICRRMECAPPADDGIFLDTIHKSLPVEKLNALRLGVYRELNECNWFRPTYYQLGRRTLDLLIGNELAMQNRINFSIQMPNDQTSLLDIHADVFGGESPYQVVQWLPLVDVFGTKAMFILPRPKSEEVIPRLKDFQTGGMKALFDAVERDLIWLKVPYGKVLIFCPNFLHGNVVNAETTTRWSLNCRFTGLFTPYGSPEKGLGTYYLPVTPRAVTRLGMAYRQPEGFEE